MESIQSGFALRRIEKTSPLLMSSAKLLKQELESILTALKDAAPSQAAYRQAEERYQKALKISYQWIKNYTELNFRSLGSYTRADLERIAAQADAF